MTTAPPHNPGPHSSRARGAAIAGALFLVALAAFATVGQTDRPFAALSAVLWVLCSSFPGALYLVAAVGLGRLARPLYRGLRDELTAQIGLGLSFQFTLSHVLGWAGLFSGGPGHFVAWTPIALGLALAVHQGVGAFRAGQPRDRAIGLSFFSIPVIALVLVAACNPPGWLWASEFGGYDALEYHLQLPQEWLAAGRITSLTHNAYSFLPSYFESAFLHLAVLTGAPAHASLVASDGRAALACQILHALTAITTALLIARVTRSLILTASDPADPSLDSRARHAGALAGGLFIAIPWVVVVSSLAYNEMALAALLTATLGVAADRTPAPFRRWVLSAWLVGVACGLKPTALTFAGAPVAIMLLGTTPPRSWLRAAPAAVAAGLLALAPWLARNFLAGGNPVFPYLSDLFGSAHWTHEQVARYLGAHHTGLSWTQRLALLVSPDPATPGPDLSVADDLRLLVCPDPNDLPGQRYRGLLHPQWSAFFPLVLASIAGVVGRASPLRRAGSLLALGLVAQIVLWLTTTHLQSRFLLPLAIPGSVLFGLAMSLLLTRRIPLPSVAVSAVAGLPILPLSAASVMTFTLQQHGKPNDLLAMGPGLLSGELFRQEIESAAPSERGARLENVSPEIFCNLMLGRDSVLYLLGDSTPFYLTCPVVYHTTWDSSPLGDAIRAAPDDPGAWAASLRARGITHILYNAGEIDRLRRSGSGWYDPGVTPELAARWLESSAELVRSWPSLDRYLFRLR